MNRNRSQLATDYDVCAARVIAADIDESKLRLAREAGADETARWSSMATASAR